MHHGQGGKKDEIDGNAERFFRAVDRVVLEHHSRPSGPPLMLAALPKHHHLFRKVSHNPFLMASGLMVDHQGTAHGTCPRCASCSRQAGAATARRWWTAKCAKQSCLAGAVGRHPRRGAADERHIWILQRASAGTQIAAARALIRSPTQGVFSHGTEQPVGHK
jgi:hypothetical protein